MRENASRNAVADDRHGPDHPRQRAEEIAGFEAGQYVVAAAWDEYVDEVFDEDDDRRDDGCPFDRPEPEAVFEDRGTGRSLLLFDDESLCKEVPGREPRVWRWADQFLREEFGPDLIQLHQRERGKSAAHRLAQHVGY